MPGRLTELRKQAGYSTAKDFAAAIGVPATTYGRYESQPEKIPMRAAWELADRFGVTIDQIVGRDDEHHGDPRGQEQRSFDALSDRSQEEARDLMAWLADRDEREARDTAAKAEARWEVVEEGFERWYLAHLPEGRDGRPDPTLLADPDRLRAGFEALARDWLVGSERPMNPYAPEVTDEAAVDAVMAAYDRAHGRREGAGHS